MALTPEAKVKKKVVAQLKELGAYYFYHGVFFGIECKAGKNKPTALQDKNLKQIRNAGGLDLIVNEDNMYDVIETLEDEINSRNNN